MGEEQEKSGVAVRGQSPQSRAERRGGKAIPVLPALAARSVTQGQVRLVSIHIHCPLAKFTFS